MFFFKVSAVFSLDLSINAAIWLGSKISFFSNSETCLICSLTSSGFCFFLTIFFFSLFKSSGKGILSGFSFFFSAGGACSETTLSSLFFFIYKIVFEAFDANGMLVVSVICINSTDKMGGKSTGVLNINGKLIAVKTIITEWKTKDKNILLVMLILIWFRY